MKIKRFFTLRVNILLFVLLLTLIAINPNPFAEGIEVKSVNGEVAIQGLKTGDSIESINNNKISTIQDFNSAINTIKINSTLIIKTKNYEIAYITTEIPDITVQNVKKTNIQKGLDLSGGTRALLRPDSEETVSDQDITNLINILNNRLNTYGLSDVQTRPAKDLDGNRLVLIEIAGASRQEVKGLIEQQGKFETKIGNKTVFVGSEKDITFVCKDDGTCSGIQSCNKQNDETYLCTFEFQIKLSSEAAKRHADITKNIPVKTEQDGSRLYLELPLDLYLDNKLVSTLQISETLKGKEATSIAISGPGLGPTQEIAYDEAFREMTRLQTILITGSLPFGLKIEKLDGISPFVGNDFIKNAFLVGFLALVTVAISVFIRFKTLKIVIPMMITMMSEIFIILGVAAFIGWRLDLVSIAGIIASVGTGVDDQIVITDEVIKGEARGLNWKQRIKRAFFIILSAYATTLVAMLPLWNAGAGLVRGFAVTTIIGITIGVFITRPAYANMIERLLNE